MACSPYCPTTKKNAACSSEVSEHFHQTTWHHIPKDDLQLCKWLFTFSFCKFEILQGELKVLIHPCKNSTALCRKSGSPTHKTFQVAHTKGSLPMLTGWAPNPFMEKGQTHYCGLTLSGCLWENNNNGIPKHLKLVCNFFNIYIITNVAMGHTMEPGRPHATHGLYTHDLLQQSVLYIHSLWLPL